MTPASKVGAVPKRPDECLDRPEWQINLLERLLLDRGYPAHLVKQKAIECFDWACNKWLEAELDRAIYGSAIDEQVGIIGQYKGSGNES